MYQQEKADCKEIEGPVDTGGLGRGWRRADHQWPPVSEVGFNMLTSSSEPVLIC